VNGAGSFARTSETGGGGVAYLAHVGGFVAGLVLVKLFARPAAPVLWLANGLNARVLASRTARLARTARRSSKTVA
jgi:hypothetical protein